MNPYNQIAKPFWDILEDCLEHRHTHYWLKGGRGSTKSSFIGIIIPLLMMIDGGNGIQSNAVAMRKVGDTLTGSVYNQIIWGIEKLGVSDYWKAGISPLMLEYKPTGQQILFRSSANKDDYRKIKSIKFKKGYCRYAWFEELDEFFGMEEIRSINQSLLRGRRWLRSFLFVQSTKDGSFVGKCRKPHNKRRQISTFEYIFRCAERMARGTVLHRS